MNLSVRVGAIAASALTAVALLSGCSGTSSSDTSRAAAGASQELPAPVMVADDQSEASGVVGNTFVFEKTYDAGSTIAVDKPDVLQVSQAVQDGGANLNAGGLALAAGTATVTITNPDDSTREVVITVNP